MAIPRVLLASLLLPPGLLALYEGMRSRGLNPAPPAPAPAQATTSQPPAQTSDKPRVASPALVESTDTLRLTLSRDSVSQRLKFVQFVKNESDGNSRLECVRVLLRDSLAQASSIEATVNGISCAADSTRKLRLPAQSLTAISIEFAAPSGTAPFVGHVTFETRDSTTGKPYLVPRLVKLSYAATTRGSPYAELFVLGTLIMSLAIAVAATKFADKGATPNETLTWDLSSSWASNVGVAGGLVTALVTAAFLPDQPRYLAKPAYALLSTVFVAITALAPSVYAFVAKLGDDKARSAAVALASSVTLWGALGQIAVAWALFGELVHARVIPRVPAKTFQGLMIALAILLVVHAWFSIRALLNPPAQDAAAAASGKTPYKLL